MTSEDLDHGGLPEGASLWHFESSHLATWMELIGAGQPLSEAQNHAFEHCFDSMWRLVRKFDGLTALRETVEMDSISEDQKHTLFELTESYYHGFYSAISALSGLMARYANVFGRNIPSSSVQKYIIWLENRYRFGLPIEFLSIARRFRTILAHPEQHPAFTWGYAASSPTYIFLHGAISPNGFLPHGARVSEFEQLPDRWIFPAPDERWVLDSLGLFVLTAVLQIREPFIDGEPRLPAFKNFDVGDGIYEYEGTFYIPTSTQTR